MPLQRAQELLRDVLEDAVFVLDRDGVIRQANVVAGKLLHCLPADLAGRRFSSLVNADQEPLLERTLSTLEPGQPPSSIDLVLVDGLGARVESRVTFARGGEGELDSIGVAVQRKPETSADHDGLVLKAAMLAIGTMGNSVKDLRPGGRTHWSPQMYTLTGVAPETPIDGDTMRALVHPADAQEARAARQRALDASDSFDAEFRIVRANDGQPRWMRVTTQVLRDPSGKPERIIDVMRDVTDSRAASSALTASEEQLRRVMASTSDGVMIHDDQGFITFANQRFEKMLGYGAGALNGKPASILVPPERRAALATHLSDRLSGISARSEVEYLRADGTRMPAQVRVDPVLDEKGKPVGGLCTLRDLSQERAAAEKLTRLEDQLRSAQKLEAIGSLAAGIAHDFNNLLTVILANSTMALEELPPGRPAGLLEEVRQAGERASDLTRRLLAFGRKQLLRPAPVDLAQLTQGLAPLLTRLLPEDVTLRLALPARPPLVLADRAQLEQVVVNLCVNARDAMPNGGTLTVKLEAVDLDEAFTRFHLGITPGPHLLLTVTDTGVGMTREVQEHIFEPFFSTKGDKGTGLGLATVFGIVKQSGGSIWVESAVGKGSSFQVYLPVNEAQLPAPEAVSAAPAKGKGETVLVVEDDPQVRRLVCLVLKRGGYQVLEANDAADALAKSAAAGPIDLLLTDLVMPGMNGRELTERLLPTREKLKVLFMSGYTDDAILKRGLLAGTFKLLEKPLTPDALLRGVRAMLDGPG